MHNNLLICLCHIQAHENIYIYRGEIKRNVVPLTTDWQDNQHSTAIFNFRCEPTASGVIVLINAKQECDCVCVYVRQWVNKKSRFKLWQKHLPLIPFRVILILRTAGGRQTAHFARHRSPGVNSVRMYACVCVCKCVCLLNAYAKANELMSRRMSDNEIVWN